MPVGWILYRDNCIISLYKLKKNKSNKIKVVIEKQIVFQPSLLNVSYYINQKRKRWNMLGLKQLLYPLDIIEITKTVQLFDKKYICQGGPSTVDFQGKHFKNIFLVIILLP